MSVKFYIHESRIERRRREKRRRAIITIYLFFVAISILSTVWYRAYQREDAKRQAAAALLAIPTPEELGAEYIVEGDVVGYVETIVDQSDDAGTDPVDMLPHDKLFITSERRRYQDQDLTLIIPKLKKTLPIYDGVSIEVLNKGVGLYDYAQLPGKGNRNVSVAGHRNTSRFGIITDNAPFYYIDRLEDGDYLYLVGKEEVYRYLYEDTKVIEADDWGPIYSQGFSCLTITSCTPIGIGSHRIVVRGRLDEIFALTEDFSFPVNRTGR
ncbi:MAG: class E sortase [Peptococcaceae bacterium]|jgi:LPXTG-site transpeptidase (sortase) family protein|nr:class E sortase [Peptococcaceae bacterium]